MNNKIVAATLVVAGILFLGCCTNINAGTIDNLGTMNYKGFLQVDVPGNANLLFISCSDGMSGSDVAMQNVGYQSTINATKYIFTSNVLVPEWWMSNSTVSYLYQEIGTLQLYEVVVDYSSMVIPPSPDMVLYQNLSEEYGFLNVSYNNLTMGYSVLNLSFNNLTIMFENLSLNHTEISEILANLTIDYSNSTAYIKELKGNLSIRNAQYDNLYTAFTNMSGNISQYETRATNAEGKLWTAENDIDDMEELIGAFPLWVVLVGLLEAILLILYFKRDMILGKKRPHSLTQETETGYTDTARKIDYFTLMKEKIVKAVKPNHNKDTKMVHVDAYTDYKAASEEKATPEKTPTADPIAEQTSPKNDTKQDTSKMNTEIDQLLAKK